MKENNDLYKALTTMLAWSIVAAALLFVSCYFTCCTAPFSADYIFIKPNVVDTIPQDTIPEPIEVDTCTGLVEVTEPAFVTLYMLFDDPQADVLWEGGGIQSSSLQAVMDHLTVLPSHSYQSEWGGVVIIDNTNNHQFFQTKVFARVGGAKWYMGSGKQAFIFPILTAEQYQAEAVNYPSVNQFSFWGTNYDSTTYIQLSETILGECKEGRWRADFRQSPFEMDTSVVNKFINAGWENVYH